MPTEVIRIKADNIDDAARKIIGFLDDTSKGNVIYFDGWHGLRASAVLKVVTKRLGSLSGAAAGTVGFDKIIHVDCSLWESKRALQKAIAKELELPQSVMAIFDQRDKDDDFNEVEQASRGVIEDVARVIFTSLATRRFLVVFHNGSGSYIDLQECGVPITGILSNRVLWTSRGRFQLQNIQDEEVKKIAGLSDIAICCYLQGDDRLREEAKKVIQIHADNIDGAAEVIIGFLDDTSKGNVIYFDGWGGLGASTVLKVVAKQLGSSSSSGAAAGTAGFDKIIHVDCSLWESKRALQKAIAKELGLPQSVMAIFDHRDDDDDFNGVEQGSRGVIEDVTSVICRSLLNCRFLVVFHNGSGGYIDLYECGVPIITLFSNKLLWTSRGRFQLQNIQDVEVEKIAGPSNVAIHCYIQGAEDMYDKAWDILCEEAKEVVRYTGIPEPDMNPKIVEECILYKWALRDDNRSIDWGTHAPNYWICDGIIQTTKDGDRSAWEIVNALHRNMRLDWDQDWELIIGDAIEYYGWRPNDRWVSTTRQYLQQGDDDDDDDDNGDDDDEVQMPDDDAVQVPPQATSIFRTSAKQAIAILPAGMFDRSGKSRLRVIQLSWCAFSFSSPPFHCCSNLRFLLLHHCKDNNNGTTTHHGREEEHQSHSSHDGGPWRACFRNLWVLDLSYTDWYWLLSEEMMDVMADLRELNVKGVKRWSISTLRCGGGARSSSYRLLNLVKLRVTAMPTDSGRDHRNNINQASSVVVFPDLSCSRSLKTIVLDGFVTLEKLGPDVLPPSLESFSLLNNVAEESIEESAKEFVEKSIEEAAQESVEEPEDNSISFRGCTQLKSLLLRGLFGSLMELDMSGTSVKTLDLSAMLAPHLRRIFLLGCEKLRAILWPWEVEELLLDMLRIDTTRAAWAVDATSSRPSSITMLHGGRAPTYFDYYIFIWDARLLRSLVPVRHCIERKFVHIEISSSPTSTVTVGGSEGATQGIKSSKNSDGEQQPTANLFMDVADAFKDQLQAGLDNKGGGDTPATTWMRPCPTLPNLDVNDCYLHIQDEMKAELPVTATLADFICDRARILHVHDSLSITCIHSFAGQVGSRWTSLRWCRLERCPKLEGCVFANPMGGGMHEFVNLETFWASQLLKARYIWNWSTYFWPDEDSFKHMEFLHLDNCPRLIHVLPYFRYMSLGWLVTLEIVYCGDLKEVFPLEPEQTEHTSTMNFPKLRYLHLHELPMLQCICGRRMSAPKLETVKIRGCWSLRRLPAISRKSKPAEVDCEKEWWDGLEWDGVTWPRDDEDEEVVHHPSLYRPTHSRYYKRTLRRGSLLR